MKISLETYLLWKKLKILKKNSNFLFRFSTLDSCYSKAEIKGLPSEAGPQ